MLLFPRYGLEVPLGEGKLNSKEYLLRVEYQKKWIQIGSLPISPDACVTLRPFIQKPGASHHNSKPLKLNTPKKRVEGEEITVLKEGNEIAKKAHEDKILGEHNKVG